MIEKKSFLWRSISLGIVIFFCLIIIFTYLPIRVFFNCRGQNVKLEENNSDRNTLIKHEEYKESGQASQKNPKNSTISHTSDLHPITGMTLNQLRTRCGVNCLYVISKYYNIDISYEELRLLLNPTQLGISMLTLKEVAEGLGYEVKALELSAKDIMRFSDLMIALFVPQDKQNIIGHYTVLIPMASKGGVWILDPPHRKIWVDQQSLENSDISPLPVLLLRPKIITHPSRENAAIDRR
jgi:hypothetical protein